MNNNRSAHKTIGKVLIILMLVAMGVTLAVGLTYKFKRSYFGANTYIEGVDCSFLTIEQAKQQIESKFAQEEITLKFANHKQYVATYGDFDFQLSSTEPLTQILAEQSIFSFEKQDYCVENYYSINTEMLKEYLAAIAELQQENMTMPQDAFLQLGDNQLLEIVPEVAGNYINFDEAYDLVETTILSLGNNIDFSGIMHIEPEIVSTNSNLVANRDIINVYLATTINFELEDNSIYTLDKSIMCNWVYQTSNGDFQIELETHVMEFINLLSEKANEINSTMKFPASDVGTITIDLPENMIALVDENAEFLQIMQELGTAKTITRSPIYNKQLIQESLNTYVELDLTRQNVWMYVDGECILSTACVTGNVRDGNGTPEGIYYLTYKSTNAVLRGYNNDGSLYEAKVTYWMPFNMGIGFHDATWRASFGGEIYKTNGSHGCVNLPYDAAKTLYENIDSSIPIIVYSS